MTKQYAWQLIVNPITSWLKTTAGVTIIVCIAIAVLAAIDKGSYILINAIVTGGMWALVAMGLALVFGVMNVVSFVHGEFFMIGALAAYFVFTPLNNYLFNYPNAVLVAIAPLMAMSAAVVVGIIAGILSETHPRSVDHEFLCAHCGYVCVNSKRCSADLWN